MSADVRRQGVRLADEVWLGLRTLDAPFAAWTAAWTAASLVTFGILNAIIPTPFFVRPIAAEPFAIATWLLSAPLMGFVLATYTSPAKPLLFAPMPLSMQSAAEPRDRSTLAWMGGLGSFLAIGCPVCNKVALVLLGTSGALELYGPIQPLIGVASIVLLLVTVAWRLRIRGRAGCAVAPVRTAA